jgi:hypothetical protein
MKSKKIISIKLLFETFNNTKNCKIAITSYAYKQGKEHAATHKTTMKKALQRIILSCLTFSSFLPNPLFFPHAYHLPHFPFPFFPPCFVKLSPLL